MSTRRWAVGVCLLSVTAGAEAYVGPGMGLGVIGALLGLLAAVFLAVAGIVWYPLKRMLRAKRNGAEAPTSSRPGAERPPSETRPPLRQ